MTNRSATTPPRTKVRKGPARLGAIIPGAVGPVFAKRGFAGADLAVHWAEIVGPGVAAHSRPINLQWPRHGAENGVGATLVTACNAAFALDLQQMAPVIMERINQRLGWRCVTRLTIRQMPVKAPVPPVKRLPPNAADQAEASRIAAGIKLDSLRDVMTRLGAATIARSRAKL